MGKKRPPEKRSFWSKLCYCFKSNDDENPPAVLENSFVPRVTSLDSLQMVSNQTGHLVVVKIFAEWAKPCQESQMEFALLARDYPEVLFYKVLTVTKNK